MIAHVRGHSNVTSSLSLIFKIMNVSSAFTKFASDAVRSVTMAI